MRAAYSKELDINAVLRMNKIYGLISTKKEISNMLAFKFSKHMVISLRSTSMAVEIDVTHRHTLHVSASQSVQV